jgi:hypothetical protein
MTDEQNHRPVNTKLQAEIESKLNQHKVPKIDKKTTDTSRKNDVNYVMVYGYLNGWISNIRSY